MTNKLLMPIAAALLLLSGPGAAQNVDIASLGLLELKFEQASAVDAYPAQQVAAQVAFRPGDAFTLSAPGRVQQINYLVEAGASVEKGQSFAVLRGPEMHHFEIAYEASRELLEASEARFNSNRALYQRKAIPASQWIAASENYYAARMEYEHLRHFNDLVVPEPGDHDTITLKAPLSGVIDYAAQGSIIEADGAIASFIPPPAIRLQVALPAALRGQVSGLQAGECKLTIDRTDAVIRDYFVTAWTEALTSDCHFTLGQQLLATPLLRTAAYRVPAAAVFQWQRASHVLLRSGQSLAPVPVSILAEAEQDYILQADQPLQGREILVTSVSAVQGILLGLGGE